MAHIPDSDRQYPAPPPAVVIPVVIAPSAGLGDRTANLSLTEDSAARKATPMVSGLLDYFPAALAAVAAVSKVGNDKHNPGQPMHHARGKSMDHADCIVRHLVDRGYKDDSNVRHSAYVAWRALALLQQELEDAGEAPMPRGARPA